MVKYKIKSGKIKGKIRLAVLSDLHSFNHGSKHEPQEKLVRAVKAQNPDAILMAGDIADHIIPHANTKILLRRLSEYPKFYVTGNHEYKSGEINEIKRFFRELGAEVLEGVNRKVRLGENKINIAGVDDAVIGGERFKKQLQNCAQNIEYDLFTIFLAHRPEKVNLYKRLNPDLILTGHAHGGQIVIPHVVNGIYAVNQGFFPKYTGGLYEVGGNPKTKIPCKMVVSRGLSKSTRGIPRVFNRPELVIIDVVGK
ncbi:MAG: metallophosphoesterase [Oscillospiraceae bacterium]|nr:metallophosphoesterase [Oscillospiraceae bacterium]